MKTLKTWTFLFLIFGINAMAAEGFLYKKEAQSPLFQNISGWMSKGLILKKRVNLNQAFDRSPNPREFKSVEDSFAINYEFFKNDPEFKCRRPSYYKYFANLFKMEPFSGSKCKMNLSVTLISESSTANSPLVSRTIDPSRIYQIHYLFAGKGKQMMSRWGHAMFRLVLCAPEREMGPGCLQDYAYHIVVNYRANIEDNNISYKKGINGAYPSQLFLMNMSEVVAEYTKGEFRDVISLPMKMTRDEISNFTDKLLENYWGYKGRYYFLTNNCATEAMNLLRATFVANAKIQTANIVTPLGLYDYLIKSNIADITVLDNRQKAIKLGHLFPGVSEKLQKSLNLFAGKNGIAFEDFALKLSAAERKEIYAKGIKEEAAPLSLYANALRIEEQILLSREQQFAKKIGDALFGKEPMPELKDTPIEEKIGELKNLYKQLTSESYLAPGYGIPLEGEYKVASLESIQSIKDEIQSNMEELKDIAITFFPKEVEEMNGTLLNRQWILEAINNL